MKPILPSTLLHSSGSMLRRLPALTTPAIRSFTPSPRSLSDTPNKNEGKQNSTPGWGGRPGDDHVLHRDHRDAQSAPSHEARADKEAGKEGSNAISQKDERNANQRAQEEHPEAPGPVIGMNSERGGKK